jgi:glycosyltransferase involved in cell wall biosynthesis
MKLALLTEIPAPFRIPLWNALADRVELRVLFLSERDPRRAYDLHEDEWRFDSRVLPGRSLLARGRWLVFNRRLRAELRRFGPDALLIGGWNQPAFFQAARSGTPYVLWVESTARDERRGRLESLKRRLLASAAGVLVPGMAARDYVVGLGVEPGRVAVAPNAFDLTAFTGAVERARGRHGPTVLTVARLSPEKDVATLLRAAEGLDAELVVVGDGPQGVALREAAPPNARFAGQAPRDELPRWYANADVFALVSRSETWGMALSEAAAAGLPLVATDAVGGAWDLIEPGVNGYRVPVGDVEALREALSKALADEAWREHAGRRSRELAEQATPERWAEVVEAFFERLVT